MNNSQRVGKDWRNERTSQCKMVSFRLRVLLTCCNKDSSEKKNNNNTNNDYAYESVRAQGVRRGQ